jgi:hydrogenase nickel incorporation protein HypA/HybF
MHEIGLIQAVMDEISRAAEANNVKRVTRVRLVVGRLNGALPEVLEFAFSILAPETMFEGARLEIKSVPVTLNCPQCGAESAGDELTCFCPDCGGRAEIVSGRELHIDYFEGDDGKEDAREGSDGPENLAGQRAGGL